MLTGLLLLAALGCSTAPAEQPQSARLTFSADRYPAVFEAAVETLRDRGYRIARRDYRFGTITTYPKESATLAEFWIDDATTPAQRRADTLNSQQRTVTVNVAQPGEEPGYALTVEVLVQRLQRPERYLTHSASPRISTTYTDVPMHLKDRGIDGPYAQTLSRDPLLERRLIEAIRDAIIQAPSSTSSIPADLGPKDKQAFLGQKLAEQQNLAQDSPEHLFRQLKYAEALLELAKHDPLTSHQRDEDPDLVTLDRFQREQEFTSLFDLIERLIKKYPNDSEVIDLKVRTQAAIAEFQRVETSN